MMKTKLFEILGEIIGVEPEDINESDSLRDDLHMNSVDLTELAEKLTQEGLGAAELSSIDTVEDLIAALNLDDEI